MATDAGGLTPFPINEGIIIHVPNSTLPVESLTESVLTPGVDQAAIVLNNLGPALIRVSASHLLGDAILHTLRTLVTGSKIDKNTYELLCEAASNSRTQTLMTLIGQGIVGEDQIRDEWNGNGITDKDFEALARLAAQNRHTLGFSHRVEAEAISEEEEVIATPIELRPIVLKCLELMTLTNANLYNEFANIFNEALGGGITWEEYDFVYARLKEKSAEYLAGLIRKGMLQEPKSRLMTNYQVGLLSGKQYLELVELLEEVQHGKPMGFTMPQSLPKIS